MARLFLGLVILLAACRMPAEDSVGMTHNCVTTPSGLVECNEIQAP
ncbi:MAG: hypothetical protein JJU07_01600 [Natronohydrobacter sp.]|nr:hypothetical protein [Natronohydrobacter sp.]